MAHKDKKQSNKSDELIDMKSLIGDADGGGFSLDDILSEYGVPPRKRPLIQEEKRDDDGLDDDLPWPESPRRSVQENRVVTFPGGQSVEDQPEEEAEEETAFPEEEETESAGENEEKIIEFPEEESAFTALIKDLKDRANGYADQMFEASEKMDPAQIRRLEKLIPGTDQEEKPEEKTEKKMDLRFVRPPRREEAPPPDVPPQELARDFAKKLKGMRLRIVLLFFLSGLALTPVFVPMFGVVLPAPLDHYQLQVFFSAALLAAGILLSVNVLKESLERLKEGGMVELDEERKAAMVSNLLVVLCGNKDAQPIVNSGSLY